ncbi:MAG: hypothetical protein K2K80_00240, partial [Clostridia bacterium]|nr:hypothetical protein [Clostridia bacterium]
FSWAASDVYKIQMYAVSIMLFVILLSLRLSSYYAVDGKTFKTSFGIIKSKYDIEKIENIVLDRETNKLSVYFDENNFIVISVREDWYEDFIDSLLAVNRKIAYTIKSKENKDNEEKK